MITTRYILSSKQKENGIEKYGNGYMDMRKYLGKIDWNNTLKNNTATEGWNILKSEIDCIVDKLILSP